VIGDAHGVSDRCFWMTLMPVTLLGISSSPRIDGNSELLLNEALRGAADAGADAQFLACRDLAFTGCTGCNSCFKTGACVIQDDMQRLLASMIECDRLIFATPIFFMNVPWLGKMAIDRCQCLWARRYVLKLPLFDPPRPDRRAAVIAVGATGGKSLFNGLNLTMRHFLHALEMNHAADLHVRRVDAKGAILNHPTAMKDAYEIGRMLASE